MDACPERKEGYTRVPTKKRVLSMDNVEAFKHELKVLCRFNSVVVVMFSIFISLVRLISFTICTVNGRMQAIILPSICFNAI